MSMSLPQPSGSAKIYATASKEWVIPPKQKPGRKPKAIPQDDLDFADNDTSEHGKKSQNRSAQRAFRERRQTQLSELQARIKQYEQGEVERSVTLQALGIRLKTENGSLKEQNTKLKEENDRLKARLASCSCSLDQPSAAARSVTAANVQRGTKRGRVESPRMFVASLKRLKIEDLPPHQANTPSSSSSNSVASHAQHQDGNDHCMEDNFDSISPATEHGNTGQEAGVAQYSCGMCTSSMDCLCRQLGLETPLEDPIPNVDDDAPMSILDNLPPYRPAVPLPGRTKRTIPQDASPSSMRVVQEENAETGCSGDPRNCPACRHSEFGRAFCSALGNSVCMLNPCPNCQSKSGPSSDKTQDIVLPSPDEPTLPLSINPSLTQCCGDPMHCKGGACTPPVPKSNLAESSRRRKAASHERGARSMTTKLAPLKTAGGQATVSCDVVWKALEAHPNAHLANPTSHLSNLNLLADVVARRSYCTLALGETTPEPEDFPRRARTRPRTRNQTRGHGSEGDAVNNHADARVSIAYEDDQNGEGNLQKRMMVPREVLQGHQRITTVPAEGMREAIALLDQQFGCS